MRARRARAPRRSPARRGGSSGAGDLPKGSRGSGARAEAQQRIGLGESPALAEADPQRVVAGRDRPPAGSEKTKVRRPSPSSVTRSTFSRPGWTARPSLARERGADLRCRRRGRRRARGRRPSAPAARARRAAPRSWCAGRKAGRRLERRRGALRRRLPGPISRLSQRSASSITSGGSAKAVAAVVGRHGDVEEPHRAPAARGLAHQQPDGVAAGRDLEGTEERDARARGPAGSARAGSSRTAWARWSRTVPSSATA